MTDWKTGVDTYPPPCVKQDSGKLRPRKLRLVLCDDLEGRDRVVAGRSKRKGLSVRTALTHFLVPQ